MTDFSSKLKNVWPFVLAFIGLLSWVVSQAVTASEFKGKVSRNAEKIESIEHDVEEHEKVGRHPKINEKLILLESDIKHIKINQSANFDTIKETLNVMQEDLKTINRRSHRHR